jgi:cell division protein FtsB
MNMSSDYGDFRNRQPEGVWHSLNRLLIALIMFAGILLIAYPFVAELKDQRERAARIESLKAEVQKQKDLLVQRTREEERLKNDREYIEMVARDRLDLMKEGETIYRLEAPPLDRSNFKRKQ